MSQTPRNTASFPISCRIFRLGVLRLSCVGVKPTQVLVGAPRFAKATRVFCIAAQIAVDLERPSHGVTCSLLFVACQSGGRLPCLACHCWRSEEDSVVCMVYHSRTTMVCSDDWNPSLEFKQLKCQARCLSNHLEDVLRVRELWVTLESFEDNVAQSPVGVDS